MEFKPERFLSENENIPEPDPRKLVFGFGRRICPGRLLADSSLYLNIAQTLAVFQFNKLIENGHEIEQVASFLPGVISGPAPFKTSVKPRSTQHEELIRSIEKIHPWQESDASVLDRITY
jgi:cytochrome P450